MRPIINAHISGIGSYTLSALFTVQLLFQDRNNTGVCEVMQRSGFPHQSVMGSKESAKNILKLATRLVGAGWSKLVTNTSKFGGNMNYSYDPLSEARIVYSRKYRFYNMVLFLNFGKKWLRDT